MYRNDFIARIAPTAVQNWHEDGVAASLTIAQAALESNWGRSGLAVQANNLFGIKGTGPAGSVMMPTTEYRGGVAVRENAPFRKYSSWNESIADHTRLLTKTRYAGVLHKTGQEAARAVARAGYATDPRYADKLIEMMDKYDLYRFDQPQGGDEPMTAEEKKQFEALQQMVEKQAERIKQLEAKESMPIPKWAKEAIAAAVQYDKSEPLINTPEGGSLDFYRIITILHRRGLFDKTNGDKEI